MFAHPSQQNVYNPNHEDNAYRPHHGTAEVHRHGYGDIPERQEADGGADDHTEVGHMPGHYHYHQLYQYAAYYRLITEDLLNFFLKDKTIFFAEIFRLQLNNVISFKNHFMVKKN